MCHRNEPSGALHGLMRVRGFTQDDGHIFCTGRPNSKSEVANFDKAVTKSFITTLDLQKWL
jgi:threonyl-tRNA synthetase